MSSHYETSLKKTSIEQEFGKIEISSAQMNDIDELISLYEAHGSDMRRLVSCSQDKYPSLGKTEVKKRWEEATQEIENWVKVGKLSFEAFQGIKRQSEGILHNQSIPEQDVEISDPFNMKPVEKDHDIKTLQQEQIKNILVIKINNEIACTARVLDVEGSREIVSIVTREEYRRKGLASLLIQEILARFPERPLFSFQRLHLVNYYLKEYSSGAPIICPFEELPPALQRDLFRMNIFWGPFVIIKISE